MHTRHALRVLLVDDEVLIRKLLARALREAGYSVRTVANGRSAMLLLAKREFDLLISDVVMPGIDGTALSRFVAEQFPRMKTLLISGFPEPRKLAPGVHFLAKPFGVQTLHDCVMEMLAATTARPVFVDELPDDLTPGETQRLYLLSIARFGGIAHDFNNHLTCVAGFVDVLEQTLRDVRDGGVLSGDDTKWLLAGVNDVRLALARVLYTLRWYTADLSGEASSSLSACPWEVLETLRNAFPTVRVGKPLPGRQLRVLVPQSVLLLIGNELILNSTKHARTDAPILLYCKVTKDRIAMSVHDAGPRGKKPWVPWFEKHVFREGPSSAGQGLRIVRRLVAKAGGSMSFGKSTETGGTEASVIIPVRVYNARRAARVEGEGGK